MKVIKEYLLDKTNTAPQTLYLPVGAEPVAVQDTSRGLIIQAISDFIEQSTALRTFKICAVDENIYADKIRYIDNFESAFGRCHVIEFVNE